MIWISIGTIIYGLITSRVTYATLFNWEKERGTASAAEAMGSGPRGTSVEGMCANTPYNGQRSAMIKVKVKVRWAAEKNMSEGSTRSCPKHSSLVRFLREPGLHT